MLLFPVPVDRFTGCRLMLDQRSGPSEAYGGVVVLRGHPISVCRGER